MATKYVNSITYGGNEYKLVDNSSGYEANQNAFSNVKVGSTTIAADSKTDTLELVAGDNITLTPDATNDKITISSSGGGGGSFPNNYSTITVSDGTATASVSPSSSTDSLALVAGNNINLDVGTSGNSITIGASVPSAGATASAVGTTANGGSATTWSRSDHVHSLSSTTITSALGYAPYSSDNPNGYTSNAGTVTSVRVRASSPISSSTNSLQRTSLDTTISLENAYGDTKNPYGSKTRNYVLAAPNGSAGNPSFRALVAADIPSLAASKITSGTFDAARIPNLAASKITSGTFDAARIPSLSYLPINSSNTADGEYKFLNSSYAPEISDTASGIGCANKGSRYLVNELLVDGIVAPLSAYTQHNMNTAASTIRFYKYTGNSGGQWTGLTKTAYIDTSGIYHPQVSRTDTYMLAGLVGIAVSTTQLRVQIPVPSGYSNFTPALVSGQTTANLDYNGSDASFTFSAVAKLDVNPASVSVTLTTSGLTAYRTYGFRNGRISITLNP